MRVRNYQQAVDAIYPRLEDYLQEKGFDTKKLFSCLAFTDWQSMKARQDHKYPQQRIAPGHRITLMSLEETEQWILSRLELIEASKDLSDDDLTACTREELWMSDDKFAVYKRGGKKASKLCDTRQAAEQYIQIKKIAGHIQHRPAKVKRCNYCSALPFCNQGQSYQKQGLLA